MLKYFVTGALLAVSLVSVVAPASAHSKDSYSGNKHSHGTEKTDNYNPYKDDSYKSDRYKPDYSKDQKPSDGYHKVEVKIVPAYPLPQLPIYTTPPFNPDYNAGYEKDDYTYERVEGGKKDKHNRHHKKRGRMDRYDRFDRKMDRGNDRYNSYPSYPGDYQKDQYEGRKPKYEQDNKGYQTPPPVVQTPAKPPVKNPDFHKPDVKKTEVKPEIKLENKKPEVKKVDQKPTITPVKVTPKKPCK